MDSRQVTYDATTIQVLSGIEAVRKRPAMYVGDTSVTGLHHLVYEVVDNSIDEAMAGFCSQIAVTVHGDNSVTVDDNGRGIPVDMHKTEKRPAVEVVMTVLHAGGKFDRKAYRVSGGLHGVGVSVVNALSEWLEVEVRRDGKVYHQRYERGVPVSPLQVLGRTKKTGTKVTFKPDGKIFETIEFDNSILCGRLKELAFLNAGIQISFEDERKGLKETYKFDGGLISFVESLNKNKKVLFTPVCYFKKKEDELEVEIAFQYNDGYTETVFSFANNVNTREGGTHLTGFRSGLTRAINDYGKKNSFLENMTLTGEDIREGLVGVVSVKLPEPQFEGQTKGKLGNSSVRFVVESLAAREIHTFLEEHPEPAREILNKCILTAKAREAARKARDLTRKRLLDTGALPGKLADCSLKEPEHRELFLVEGDSAGGSAKQGRDRTFQAILPLKGKIINTEKAPLDKVLSNEEIKTMISAIGAGVGEDFDLARIRYHKVIIMTDADVDGAHIRTLLLTFLFRQMVDLIKGGYVYIAQPPLYKVKRGRKEVYVDTEAEMDRLLISFTLENVKFSLPRGKILSRQELGELVSVSRRLRENQSSLENRGICFSDYLKFFQEKGVFPAYCVKTNKEKIFLKDDQELAEYVEKQGGEQMDLFSREGPQEHQLIEIFESRDMAKLLEKVKATGLTLDDLSQARITLEEGHQTRNCSLVNLYEVVKECGKKGLVIQRYKGLGEMNPEQLWETTMDPARRRLKQVTLDDAVKAEEIFTVLMGEEVEPRRQFIEQYAREVKNLDI
ncbi:MAG: DNA topoisomerase (ATP-hydrolyzing) subunit B [Candidatus Omnitrophica bacterium]|nr:DNA topoisomerase (ATP-hydrolyzing) subunit B [Candidatus Omnitrophota bacterium]